MKGKKAMHYIAKGDTIRCCLCPHECSLKPGQTGLCNVRKNEDGILYSLNYGQITASNVDPIEKKPLYHFYPGSPILSVGTFGCNLKCSFCQNHSIAHGNPKTVYMAPDNLVKQAEAIKDNIGIAYTYNEPSIWYEYILDTARLAKERGLKNVMVTNGYIKPKAMEQLLPFMDAVNIDVKAFNDGFYKKICAGSLEPVLGTVETAAKVCHVEITTLVIDGLNSDAEELKGLGQWIADIDKGIPLHISRYYPAYKMKRPPTALETITEAADILKEYLDYVYIGNVAGVDNNTYCPHCNAKLVDRKGYSTELLFESDKCKSCGKPINIIP